MRVWSTGRATRGRRARITFVCGVCGVGKSTLRPFLEMILPPARFVVHDFDDTAIRNWSDNTPSPLAEAVAAARVRWLHAGLMSARHGRECVILGPSFIRRESLREFSELHELDVLLVLLDAEPSTIRQRLQKRHPSPTDSVYLMGVDAFIDRTLEHCAYLKTIYEEDGYARVETDGRSPQEISRSVADVILDRRPFRLPIS
jgi:predicted kinase